MGWKKIKLGDVLIKKNLRLKDVPELKDPLVLGVTNTDGVVKSKVEAGQKIEDYYVIEKGDFVYNPYRINVGSIGISDLDGITSLAYVVFNVDETRLNKYLLFKLLKSDFGIKEIIRNGRGSVRNALRFEDLAKIELTLPSIEEQNAFVESFKQKEVKLELLKNHYSFQLTQLDNLNQAILQEAVQGKLVPQDPKDEPASELLKRIKAERQKSLPAGAKRRQEKPLPPIKPEEIPFEIPSTWVWCRLGEIAESTSGGTPDRSNPKFWKGNINWLKSGELNDGFINDESEEKITEEGLKNSSAKLFPKGTLLIALYGATAGKLGILNFESTTNQAVCGFFENKYYDTKYLFYYLWAFRSKIIEDSWGQAQPNISQTYLKNFPFALPPLSEQKRIVAEIEKQFAKTKQLKEHIIANQQATEQLLKALLHQAFEVKEMEKVKS
ncbi:MAG: hypothetical protein KatS3mg028_1531 [Bacteroidia bacterium]|nr:MAG: hypothetical protein KatS3mg028_1531 [Bacteroidia bacterium]